MKMQKKKLELRKMKEVYLICKQLYRKGDFTDLSTTTYRRKHTKIRSRLHLKVISEVTTLFMWTEFTGMKYSR